jgi:hypothetical protein
MADYSPLRVALRLQRVSIIPGFRDTIDRRLFCITFLVTGGGLLMSGERCSKQVSRRRSREHISLYLPPKFEAVGFFSDTARHCFNQLSPSAAQSK